jgi:hypothetical protein
MATPRERAGRKLLPAVVIIAGLVAVLVVGVVAVVLTTGGAGGDGDDGVDDGGGTSRWERGSDDPGPSAAKLPPDFVPYVVLDPGRCFDHPLLDSDVTRVETRPCAGPHSAEVISNRALTGDFGSEKELRRQALKLCDPDAERRLDAMPADGRYYYVYALFPSLDAYEHQSQSEVSCALTLSTEKDGPELTHPLP